MSHGRWLAFLLMITACAASSKRPAERADIAVPSTTAELAGEPVPSRQAPAEAPCDVTLVQGDRMTPVRDLGTVAILADAFALRFELDHYDGDASRWYAARITGSADPGVLEILPGEPLHGDGILHPFGPAAGYAGGATGYDTFQLDGQGNHYVYVDANNPSESRARIVRALGPARSLVDFDVKVFFLPKSGLHYPVAKLPLARVYLAVWLDRDLDEVIAPAELCRFTLELR